MIDTQKLRQRILDLAIRGKLVPQAPNDEPASVLLDRIRAEKERLIAEGKIKRPKTKKSTTDTPHYQNVPFEIPSSWQWVRLGEICCFLSRGKSPKYSDKPNQYPVFAQKCNLKDGGISLTQARFLDEATLNKWTDEYKLQTGDILINSTGTGTVGRTRLFNSVCLGSFPFVVPDSHVSVVRLLKSIHSEYIFSYLSTILVQDYFNNNLAGSTNQKELYIDVISNTWIPLPPEKEQRRIASCIDKFNQIIEIIDNNHIKLNESINKTKSKILELAVTGKLVSQNPDDEPAAELLRRINPKAEIITDNGHYPEKWISVRLKDCVTTTNGLWTGKKPPYKTVPVIRNANFTKNFSLDYSNIAYIEVEEKSFEKRKLLLNDLIIEKSGGSDNFPVGRPVIFDLTDGEYSYSNFTMRMRILFGFPLIPKYLYYVLVDGYNKGEMKEMQTQTTGLHNLIMDKYMDRIVTIPPIEEQSRIVAKIEELFSVLDAIKDALQA